MWEVDEDSKVLVRLPRSEAPEALHHQVPYHKIGAPVSFSNVELREFPFEHLLVEFPVHPWDPEYEGIYWCLSGEITHKEPA